MKIGILAGCAGLIVVGCATERGGVQSPYATEYGMGSSSTPWVDRAAFEPIYRQPLPTGGEAGSVRPWIYPARDPYYNYYW